MIIIVFFPHPVDDRRGYNTISCSKSVKEAKLMNIYFLNDGIVHIQKLRKMRFNWFPSVKFNSGPNMNRVQSYMNECKTNKLNFLLCTTSLISLCKLIYPGLVIHTVH